MIVSKEGEPQTKVVDVVTHHFYTKQCDNGKWMWACHKKEDYNKELLNEMKRNHSNDSNPKGQKHQLKADDSLTDIIYAIQDFE